MVSIRAPHFGQRGRWIGNSSGSGLVDGAITESIAGLRTVSVRSPT